MLKITAALLDAATDACADMLEQNRAADGVLSDFFRARGRLGPNERGFIAESAYAVLRRKRSLEHLAETARPRKLLLAALVSARGFSVRELGLAVTANEAEWLVALKGRLNTQDAAEIPPGVRLDLPDWVLERVSKVFDPDELEALARALVSPAPLDLRVNLARASRDEIVKQLNADQIRAKAAPYAPSAIRLAEKPALASYPLFRDGTIEVQDEGSQLVSYLVAPRRGEMIVDFCAGAGGKTLALATLMRSSGRVYAFDVSQKRLDRLKPRLARSGLSNIHPQWIDDERDPRVGRLAGKIDRVLVDAPCSGLGTLRRNPELKWRQSPKDIDELVVKQRAILASAARLVKPGGRLVYATCSILPDENEAIVSAFLASAGGFRVIDAQSVLATQEIKIDAGAPTSAQPDGYLRLYPHRHGTDGFFVAVLERIA